VGAVPGYYGEEDRTKQDGDLTKEKDIRIGMTANFPTFFRARFDNIEKLSQARGYIGELQTKLTVPTHMWTYFACYNQQNGKISETAFIGLNYRLKSFPDGKGDDIENVKWYSHMPTFLHTLEKMYGGSQIVKQSEDMWDTININKIRKRNERSRMIQLMALYGTNMGEGRDEHNVNHVFARMSLMTVDTQDQGDDPMEGREKRSTHETAKISTNTTYNTLRIDDMDLNANFEVTECKFVEKSLSNVTLETHVYDFVNNVLIEDCKTSSGSTLTAYNGSKQEAEKRVSNVKHISIVLKPKRPQSTTTTTTTTPP